MSSDAIVVDVGNTRIKWGRCVGGKVVDVEALAPEVDVWSKQWDAWTLTNRIPWVIAGVHPARRDELAAWLTKRGSPVRILASYLDLPIRVNLPSPGGVGIDRLLDAVAANAERRADAGAIVIDAGSAVTVDFVDVQGTFHGGVIFPGFGLMAKSLHDFTALLPIVSPNPNATPPGESTVPAIQAGILAAVVGGVERVIAQYQTRFLANVELYITGGDGPIIASKLSRPTTVWPEMTLEGVRLSGGG